MAERIVLHIGAPKTGTTYLQAVLFENQPRLREHGVLVPGSSRAAHGRAATGVRQGPQGRRHVDWERLVAAAQAWPGTVVLSNEWFSMAPARRARAALADLGGTEVHLVFTARDLVGQVPAAWQEMLKRGESSSLDDFVTSLEATSGRWRWSVLDPAVVLERWGAGLPPERVHVVTMPPRGSDPALLWERFARACLIPAGVCGTDVSAARESLGAESARLLELLGPRLLDAVDAEAAGWQAPFEWIQNYLAHGLMAPRGGTRLTMRPQDVAAVRERSRSSVQALRDAEYDVVGDLCDLIPASTPPDARHPDDISESELLEAAMTLVADMLRRAREDTREEGTRAGSRQED
ncbi:MAG TPA: hypothetical protein VFJ14_15585 [Nocardioidaceae bacterium]|nr:hypothetical protein [Nocardioidaceae bacterium]